MFDLLKKLYEKIKFKLFLITYCDETFRKNVQHYSILLKDDKHILSVFIYLKLKIRKQINDIEKNVIKYSKISQHELRRLKDIEKDVDEVLEFIDSNDYKTIKENEKFKKMTKSVFQKFDRVMHHII